MGAGGCWVSPRAPAFLGRLRVIQLPGGAGWALQQPLVYRSALPGVGEIVVPAGFVTDFASVPRWPLTFLLAGDTAHAPAVVHDFLYGTRRVRRATADLVFLEAMVLTGVPRWRRAAMWVAVRIFGWWRWWCLAHGAAD